MSAPPFVFNHRNGELQRGGKVMTLCRLHAGIFGCIAAAQGPISIPGIARAINMPDHSVKEEMPRVAEKIRPLGIRIAYERGKGRWLEFEDVPKWKPTIAPPAVLPGERW